MPLVQTTTIDIAAGAVIDNVLAGSQWEFLPYDARLDFGMTTDATGSPILRIDVYSGLDVLMESGQVSAANRTPIWPDDYPLTDVAAAGERIKVRVRNTGAVSTPDFFFAMRITPI
jgi:hypothetical protein